MELTPAHLRYLLAIYEVSQTHLDISSRSIAEKLGVTKPSVVRVLNLLMERGMIVKEYYGKIYLTDRGIFVAREVKKQLDEVLAHFPPVEEALTDEERFTAALALTAALPRSPVLFVCGSSDQIALEAVEVFGLDDAFEVEAVFAVLLELDAAALPHGGGEAQLIVGQENADGVDAVAEGLVQLGQQLVEATLRR